MMRNLLKVFLIIILFSSCFSKAKETKQLKFYFDLKGYFTNLALTLNEKNPEINKTVSKNEIKESKRIKIPNWNEEFALFIESDINKPAWKDSYTKDSSATKIIYKSNDADLKTQKIEISLSHGKPTKIHIETSANNLLYQTKENLDFYPDSLYRIQKNQNVILLGKNNYQIVGKMN
jgi:hypothetical protein